MKGGNFSSFKKVIEEVKMEKLFNITLRNDYAFKRVFGSEENKDILQDFLECILDIPSETIACLELLDK